MTKIHDIDKTVLEATMSPAAMEELVQTSEGFILRSIAAVTHRFATCSDDEWSIALSAFCHAVDTYQPDKGQFYSFAALVIKRRVLDHLRSNARYNSEISVPPETFDEAPDAESEQTALRAEVLQKVTYLDTNQLKIEIEILGTILVQYGFGFMDLADCSPRADKTKRATAVAVAAILHSPMLLGDLRMTRSLPIAAIMSITGLPRKILERHRKYIIAATEILSGEFEGIAEYMGYIREELKR